MTAVEWLVKIYLQTNKIDSFDIEQAKEMEKQQIIDARENGIIEGVRRTNNNYYTSMKESDQYYNETYGSNGSDSTLNSSINSSLNSTLNLSSQTEISDNEIEEAVEKCGFYDRVLSASPPPNTFTFSLKNNEPIIVLSEEGFKYKGEFIEDAGEVYKLFKEFLIKANRPTEISDEEINKLADDYAFRVPYDGSNDFYDKEAIKHFLNGAKKYREQLKKKQ